MVHGDDKGLRLPPKVATNQVVILPIAKKNMSMVPIKEYIQPLLDTLKSLGIRVHVDDREKISPGFKFNEWEMKGVPIRVEVGPRDMENKHVFVARRDTGEKQSMDLLDAGNKISELLNQIQENMFNQAVKFRKENTFTAINWDDFKFKIDQGGFVKC